MSTVVVHQVPGVKEPSRFRRRFFNDALSTYIYMYVYLVYILSFSSGKENITKTEKRSSPSKKRRRKNTHEK